MEYLNEAVAEIIISKFANITIFLDHCKRILQMFIPQGYSRVGAALAFLKRYEEAITAYENGLKLDPNNDQLVSGLKEVEKEISGAVRKRIVNYNFYNIC